MQQIVLESLPIQIYRYDHQTWVTSLSYYLGALLTERGNTTENARKKETISEQWHFQEFYTIKFEYGNPEAHTGIWQW